MATSQQGVCTFCGNHSWMVGDTFPDHPCCTFAGKGCNRCTSLDNKPDQTNQQSSGNQNRERALALVESGTDPTWVAEAKKAVRHVADRNDTFGTDKVWAQLDQWGINRPPEPRAMGPIMAAAVKARYLVPVGYAVSELDRQNSRPIRQYRLATKQPESQSA